jgi:hypothetical protein
MLTDFYLIDPRPQISQGDIFGSIPVARVKFPEGVPVLKEIQGMLITHDCEFDKPNTVYVLVSEVCPLSELKPESRGNIKNFKTLNTFYLPQTEGISESYIDFRRTYQVDKSCLIDRLSKSLRLKSVTDEARMALQRQLAIFFGHDRNMGKAPAVLADSGAQYGYSEARGSQKL